MVTNMLYGGPFRDMRLLQEEVNRLAQSAAAPRAIFPAINVYADTDGIVITAELPGVQILISLCTETRSPFAESARIS